MQKERGCLKSEVIGREICRIIKIFEISNKKSMFSSYDKPREFRSLRNEKINSLITKIIDSQISKQKGMMALSKIRDRNRFSFIMPNFIRFL
jgi:hypothetical protein